MNVTAETVPEMEQGKNAIPFLEGLVVGDIKGIEDGSGSYSIFTNEKGGIIDDTVISKVSIFWLPFWLVLPPCQ